MANVLQNKSVITCLPKINFEKFKPVMLRHLWRAVEGKGVTEPLLERVGYAASLAEKYGLGMLLL